MVAIAEVTERNHFTRQEDIFEGNGLLVEDPEDGRYHGLFYEDPSAAIAEDAFHFKEAIVTGVIYEFDNPDTYANILTSQGTFRTPKKQDLLEFTRRAHVSDPSELIGHEAEIYTIGSVNAGVIGLSISSRIAPTTSTTE